MKEFDLQAAKKGAPVKTRNGRPARIICFDRVDPVRPIVALVQTVSNDNNALSYSYAEETFFYAPNGKTNPDNEGLDLVMATVRCFGYVNIYKEPGGDHTAIGVYDDKNSAEEDAIKGDEHAVATVQIEWEE